jgi:hypothetical protein
MVTYRREDRRCHASHFRRREPYAEFVTWSSEIALERVVVEKDVSLARDKIGALHQRLVIDPLE